MSKIRTFGNGNDRDTDEGGVAVRNRSDVHDDQLETGPFYNEEMSRAAVGRLFDDDDDDNDSPEPIYVSGFDRNPTRRTKRNKRIDLDDMSEQKSATRNTSNIREITNKSEQEERIRSRRASARLVEDDGDEEEIDFFEAGFRDARAPRERDLREARTRDRDRDRERLERHNTDRLERSNTDRIDRGRDTERRRQPNPDPKPAVRVNVPNERPVPPEARIRKEPRNVPSPIEDEWDNFRQRYNPGELISSPRSPGNRQRRGPAPDRGGRGQEYYEVESVSPIRWIITAVAISVMVLMVFLVVRMSSMSNQLTDAQETIRQLEYTPPVETASPLEIQARDEQIAELRNEITRLRNLLMMANIDPDAPVPPPHLGENDPDSGDPTSPGAADTSGTDDFPRQITVVAGDSLSRIANRNYGTNAPEIINHIVAYNNLSNPNAIQVGQVLTLPPLPN